MRAFIAHNYNLLQRHQGPVTSGIAGRKCPRFCLFGWVSWIWLCFAYPLDGGSWQPSRSFAAWGSSSS
eukprot:1137379-Pelagomonas_calceolata.AAC.4